MSTKYEGISGLSEAEVKKSREEFGSNDLPPPDIETFWDKLKDNFNDPIIRILLLALGITLVLSFLGYADWIEGIGIAVAVFLATFISTYSEYKNESSFRDLQAEASVITNTVWRSGKPESIRVSDIVVGDYILLQAGDKIPCDGILITGELQVIQASLNGEQDPVKKLSAPKDYKPADPNDLLDPYLLFRGSIVDEGEAILKAQSVGVKTIYGQMFSELADQEERESPLQVKLSNLADSVANVGYIGATLIAISFLFKQFIMDQGYSYEHFMTYITDQPAAAFRDVVTSIILAVIVIVVAVPEGLPMMIAIVLSLNMRKLLNAKVLVRKLLGIETAGSLDILFVDKTGTLTRGVFVPQTFLSGKGQSFSHFDSVPTKLSEILSFCLRESTSAMFTKEGKLLGGNASDRALVDFLDKDTLRKRLGDVKLNKEVLFNSARKFSAVQLQFEKEKPSFITSNNVSIVKGAPDFILSKCPKYYTEDGSMEPINLEKLNQAIDELSKKGIRVIAIALTEDTLPADNALPSNLCLVGIMGIADEIRLESRPAVQLAQRAGIHVIMITGDRKETALSVAQEIGLKKGNLTSSQLAEMSDEQIQKEIFNIGVISRALPTDKSRLVKICQAEPLNKVVGMTGDGVNDSAALKKADVGFAMGSGSEVAKEASDIVILDDNFYSITQAVLYGRTIFKSIRKFIVFQSTVNAASMIIVFLGPFLGFDFPLTLIQLLWVNLVMDTLAAMAFGGEPALKRYMEEPPVRRNESIISKPMWSAILINGCFIAFLCISALKYKNLRHFFLRNGIPSEPAFLTAFFAFFIFLTAFNAFNVRTPKINIFDHLFQNSGFVGVIILIFCVQVTFTYVGGSLLRTVALTLQEWMLVIFASIIIIPFDMIRKMIFSHF